MEIMYRDDFIVARLNGIKIQSATCTSASNAYFFSMSREVARFRFSFLPRKWSPMEVQAWETGGCLTAPRTLWRGAGEPESILPGTMASTARDNHPR